MPREGGEDPVDARDGPVVAIFVYGILKGSLRQHGCWAPQRAEIEGFTLYSVQGMFPAAVDGRPGSRVVGERWLLPDTEEEEARTLAFLDGIEGVPYMYQRRVVQTDKGRAWMYVWARPTQGLRWHGEEW